MKETPTEAAIWRGADVTLQGALFGIAAFCAVVALSPEAPNRSEGQIKIALTVAVGVLVAFAASMH